MKQIALVAGWSVYSDWELPSRELLGKASDVRYGAVALDEYMFVRSAKAHYL